MQPLEIKIIHNAAQLCKVWRDEEIILASHTWWSCDLFPRFSSLSFFAVPCVFALLNELSKIFLIPFPLLLSFFLFVWREKSLTLSFSDTMKVVSLARDLTSFNLINLNFQVWWTRNLAFIFLFCAFYHSPFFLEPVHIDAGKGGGKADAHITSTKQKLRSSFFFSIYFCFCFFFTYKQNEKLKSNDNILCYWVLSEVYICSWHFLIFKNYSIVQLKRFSKIQPLEESIL